MDGNSGVEMLRELANQLEKERAFFEGMLVAVRQAVKSCPWEIRVPDGETFFAAMRDLDKKVRELDEVL